MDRFINRDHYASIFMPLWEESQPIGQEVYSANVFLEFRVVCGEEKLFKGIPPYRPSAFSLST
jgi:hypothetical protein